MKLVLEDGTTMRGRSFGAAKRVGGEVVFNTGMVGYVETLTDPSYRGQILVMTWPLQGNYGVPSPRPRGSLEPPFESDRIQVQGLVCQSHSAHPSHHRSSRSLGTWLQQEGVPAVELIDTRALVRTLRERGTMPGWLLDDEGTAEAAETIQMSRVAELVRPGQRTRYEGGPLRVVVADIGCKDNIVRSLLSRGATVERVPFTDDLVQAVRHSDGLVISNGPGDPQELGALAEQVRAVLALGKPVLGICMGNQILAMAAGGRTYKLKYGHRSHNQPVQDLLTHRCYVTSQNHGYAVRTESLPRELEPWFVNLHDGTNEGIRSREAPVRGVQFHPEASPGPQDTAFVFDDFMRMVGASR